MYIPEFACGVVSTLMVEVIAIVTASIIMAVSDGKKGGRGVENKEDNDIAASTYTDSGEWSDSTGENH